MTQPPAQFWFWDLSKAMMNQYLYFNYHMCQMMIRSVYWSWGIVDQNSKFRSNNLCVNLKNSIYKHRCKYLLQIASSPAISAFKTNKEYLNSKIKLDSRNASSSSMDTSIGNSFRYTQWYNHGVYNHLEDNEDFSNLKHRKIYVRPGVEKPKNANFRDMVNYDVLSHWQYEIQPNYENSK